MYRIPKNVLNGAIYARTGCFRFRQGKIEFLKRGLDNGVGTGKMGSMKYIDDMPWLVFILNNVQWALIVGVLFTIGIIGLGYISKFLN